MKSQPPRRRYSPPKVHTASTPQTCHGCRTTIRQGGRYVLDQFRMAYHPECRRWGITPPQAEPAPRYLADDALGMPCEGCGDTIREGERIVHLLAKPWHAECRIVRAHTA